MRPSSAAIFLLGLTSLAAAVSGLAHGRAQDGAPSSSADESVADGRGRAATPARPEAGAPSEAMSPAALQQIHEQAKGSPCEACHTEDGWLPARFAHERTGFALEGAHRKALCESCHRADYAKPPPRGCAGCHQDVHQQEFGLTCTGCHQENDWSPRFNVDAHRRTNFPLFGRHAFLPCQECHTDRRDHRFSRQTKGCVDCHLNDYERTALASVDHRASQFSTDCRSCHQPTGYRPARFLLHESCFPILTGPHRAFQCITCHAPQRRLVADGRCDTGNAACINCHTGDHAQARMDAVHDGVPGYDWTSPRCIGCHTR